MWYYGTLLTLEGLLLTLLLRRYHTRRRQRTKSDLLRWEQAKYDTQKLRFELEELRQRRGLVQELEEVFQWK